MGWRVLISFMLSAALLCACEVSPQPEPPANRPKLDGGAIGFQGNVIIVGAVPFEAPPGTVDPPEGELFVINLERSDPPAVAPVQTDGSFKVVVTGAPADEYRFQVRTAVSRSVPIDLVGDATGTIVAPVVHPLSDCLTLTPALELDFGTTAGAVAPIRVHNDCTAPLSFSAPSFRTGNSAFSLVGGPTLLVIDVGQESSLSVRFSPTAPGATEEIIFIEVPAPERDRRPISLFGSS